MINHSKKRSQQTLHVYSTLKRRGNGRVYVVSTWNTRGVFVGIFHMSKQELVNCWKYVWNSIYVMYVFYKISVSHFLLLWRYHI